MPIKRLVIFVVLFSLLAAMGSGCQPQFKPGTYTDDFGRAIAIDKPPQRIVSAAPSITEIIFALDLGDRVVGISEYSDYPEAAKLKPSIGSYYTPSVEKIVELNPDIVFIFSSGDGIIIQLEELGITTVVLQPEDIDGIMKNIALVGKITGVEGRAAELVDELEARIAAVTDRVSAAPRLKVFYSFALNDLNNPWTAGPGTFIDSVIDLAGAENIAGEVQMPYVQFSIEEVVNADPEVIVLGVRHGYLPDTMIEELRQHPIWSQLTAVKEGRVYLINGDLLNRSGPRIVQALEEMVRFIHPELFAE